MVWLIRNALHPFEEVFRLAVDLWATDTGAVDRVLVTYLDWVHKIIVNARLRSRAPCLPP